MSEFSFEHTDVSANYEYFKMSYGGHDFDNMKVKNVNVCVLPFETESTGKAVTSLYLMKYFDFMKKSTKWSTMLYRYNPNKDESHLDTAIRAVGDTMKLSITDDDIKRVFYLGEIELNHIMSGAIPCYAFNVTGMAKNLDASFEINAKLNMSLERMSYANVLRGGSQDYIIASCVFLLLSYLT